MEDSLVLVEETVLDELRWCKTYREEIEQIVLTESLDVLEEILEEFAVEAEYILKTIVAA